MSVVSRVGLENNRTSSRGDEEDEYVEQYIMRIDIVLHCLSFFKIIQKYFESISKIFSNKFPTWTMVQENIL